MNHQTVVSGKKGLKVAVALILFGAVLFSGLFSSRYAVSGEETVLALADTNVALAETIEVKEEAMQTECIYTETHQTCDEAGVALELEWKKEVFPVAESRPRITWEKNAISIGDFTPDEVYGLEEVDGKFVIVEQQTIADDDGRVNLLAFGMDKNDDDYYSFHMSYEKGATDWRNDFVEFVTNFKK
jgi:hypothetical protein